MSRKCGCLVLISCIFISLIFVVLETVLFVPFESESVIARYVSPDAKQCIRLTYSMEKKKILFYYMDNSSDEEQYLGETETKFSTTPKSRNYNVAISNNTAIITIDAKNSIKEVFEVKFEHDVSIIKVQ